MWYVEANIGTCFVKRLTDMVDRKNIIIIIGYRLLSNPFIFYGHRDSGSGGLDGQN